MMLSRYAKNIDLPGPCEIKTLEVLSSSRYAFAVDRPAVPHSCSTSPIAGGDVALLIDEKRLPKGGRFSFLLAFFSRWLEGENFLPGE